MNSPAIVTVIKMLEMLPENLQNQVADHLREYLTQLQEEARWDELFAQTQDKLVEAAQLAKQQIAEGKATPMDYDAL